MDYISDLVSKILNALFPVLRPQPVRVPNKVVTREELIEAARRKARK